MVIMLMNVLIREGMIEMMIMVERKVKEEDMERMKEEVVGRINPQGLVVNLLMNGTVGEIRQKRKMLLWG